MTKHELEVLRRGLERFRHINERSGRPLPWKTVIALLLDCPSTTHEHPETGDENEFREEALRRFAKGKSTLLPERLADVKRFLIAQGTLLGQAYDAIFVRDEDARITLWNGGAERVYGWAASDAVGRAAEG